VFDREGTAAVRMYIYKVFNVRMRAWEIREFLGVDDNKGAMYAQEAHRNAWYSAGWNGSYSPIGHGPDQDKRIELVAAGLLKSGEKICIL